MIIHILQTINLVVAIIAFFFALYAVIYNIKNIQINKRCQKILEKLQERNKK